MRIAESGTGCAALSPFRNPQSAFRNLEDPMPRTPQDMKAAVIAILPARTARPADDWVAFTREHRPARHRERVAWL